MCYCVWMDNFSLLRSIALLTCTSNTYCEGCGSYSTCLLHSYWAVTDRWDQGLWQKDIGACCFINQIVFILFSCLPPHSAFAQLSQPVDIPFVFPLMLVGKALVPFQSFSFYINEQGSYATLYPWSLKNRH